MKKARAKNYRLLKKCVYELFFRIWNIWAALHLHCIIKPFSWHPKNVEPDWLSSNKSILGFLIPKFVEFFYKLVDFF